MPPKALVLARVTFRIVKELDAGPVFGVLTEIVRPDDTSGALLDRLAVAGAGLLLATPTVGFLFGMYLYVCVNLFHVHYDEAFSALQVRNFKGFLRFHITPKVRGALRVRD